MSKDLALLICTERGVLEKQALLLVRSLRRFGGALASLPVYSFAPREGRGVAPGTAAMLRDLGVVHVEEPLNTSHPDYPLANKPRVCSWAERNLDHEVLAWFDSDQLVFNEPRELRLAPGEDAAVQPEPVLGIGAGPGDPLYPAWTALLSRHEIDEPYFTRTVIDEKEIVGYWNTGLVAVRRSAGIFARWEEIFEANWQEEIWSKEGDQRFFTEQMSFGLSLMAKRARVRTLSRDHNYHIVIHDELPEAARIGRLEDMTTMHYHKLIPKSPSKQPFRRVKHFAPSGERYDWLRDQMRELGLGRPAGMRGVLDRASRKLASLRPPPPTP